MQGKEVGENPATYKNAESLILQLESQQEYGRVN